jgi:hypothetical protein
VPRWAVGVPLGFLWPEWFLPCLGPRPRQRARRALRCTGSSPVGEGGPLVGAAACRYPCSVAGQSGSACARLSQCAGFVW